MPFPEAERVIYDINPLQEVICQLRFPTILEIDTERPTAFQKRIRKQYPVFRERPDLPIGLPQPIEQLLPLLGDNRSRKIVFDFVSRDNNWRISLASNFFALTTNQYRRWEDFRSRFLEAFSAISELYEPAFLERIGLRYVNGIQKTSLNVDDSVPWSRLLQPQFSGLLGKENTSSLTEEFAASTLIKLVDAPGHVRLQYGLGADAQQHPGFLIDSDFYTEERTELNGAIEILEQYRTRARRLFRWAITDELHNAMGPRNVDAK